MSFERVAIIGLGLLGGSIGLAVRQHLPGLATVGYDSDPHVRLRAAERGLAETGYAVRHLPGQGLPHGLRITIGTREQMDEVAATLRFLAEGTR